MKILNQNLQEGLKAEEAKAQQTVSKAQSKATVKSQPSKQVCIFYSTAICHIYVLSRYRSLKIEQQLYAKLVVLFYL